jgi:hypothetical protein
MAGNEFYKKPIKSNPKSVYDEEQGPDLESSSGRLDGARRKSQDADGTLGDIDDAIAAHEEDPGTGAPDPNDAEEEEADQLSDAAGPSDSASRQDAGSGANNNAGWKTSVGDNKKKTSVLGRMSTARKLWLGGAGAMVIISGLFAFFSFISPYKAEAIIKSIEARVGEVPQNAVDHRLEFYMARYLMLRAAMKADTNFEKDRGFTYIGNGVFKTLYVNWKGADVEAQMEKGIYPDGGHIFKAKLIPDKPVGQLLGRDLINPQHWTLQYLDDNGKPILKGDRLDSKEARQYIKWYTTQTTKPHQVVKRLGMRWVLKKYYGVDNWKPFERTQNNAKNKYLEKKATFKKFMIKQTVGRVSDRYAAYFSCLVDGGDRCKEENLNPPNEEPGGLDTDMEKAIDEDKEIPDKNLLTKKLEEIGMKKVLTGVAAGAGLGLTVLEIMGGIQSAVQDGSLSHVTYDSLSQQYAGFGTAIQSATDQINSGDDFDIEDPRVLAETFSGFEASPVFNAVNNAKGPYVRDCDGDGTNDTTLEPGEYVCPSKRLIQDRESIIKHTPFWPVIDALGSFYNNSGIKTVNDWFGSVLQSVFDSLGVNALFEKIMELTGLAKEQAKLVGKAIQWAIGFSLSGNEEGPDAYDATYASITVRNSAYGSSVGGDRDGTIGGAPLTDQQVSAILEEQEADRQYAMSTMSVFDRYFSTDADNSLTNYAIMHVPVTMTSMSSAFMQAINPISIVGKFGTLLTARTHAAAPSGTVVNPFHGIYFGYTNNSPALNMEEDELNETYHCDQPSADRPQNKVMGRPNGVPFDIYTQADPCLLNKEVGRVGSGYVTGDFNTLDGE